MEARASEAKGRRCSRTARWYLISSAWWSHLWREGVISRGKGKWDEKRQGRQSKGEALLMHGTLVTDLLGEVIPPVEGSWDKQRQG